MPVVFELDTLTTRLILSIPETGNCYICVQVLIYPVYLLSSGLEWWSTIIIGTVVIRLLTIPLFVLSRKSTINMQNHAEEVKVCNIGCEQLVKL